MIVRPVLTGDVDAIAELEHTLFGADHWSSRVGIVAEEAGAIVGYAAVLLAGDVADLARIAVLPSHRRRGIASAVLAEAHETARVGGLERMLLEVAESNTGARAFYAAHGYAEIARRRGYYPDGGDALVLARALG